MFQIKICGVTSAADARAAAEAGAEAIGLNFFPPTPRYVPPETAANIVSALPERICKVGVFVDSPLEQMSQLCRMLGLDAVQLHGDEPAETVAALGQVLVIRAFRLGERGLEPLVEYLRQCRTCGRLPDAVLLDSYQTGAYGGTGQVLDWQGLAEIRQVTGKMSVLLAGGLRADNVARAIAAVRPDGVDTASGVEMAPGQKDPEAMHQFVAAAKKAFARLV